MNTSRRALFLLASFSSVDITAEEFLGEITSESLVRDNHYFYETHWVEMDETRLLSIDLASEDFDAYLIVTTPNGQQLRNDDAFGSDSSLELLAEPGIHTIQASTYGELETGTYQLKIELGDPMKVQRIEGRLDPRDEQLPKGEYVDTYSQNIRTSNSFSVRLLSYGFDGFLIVQSPSGRTWRNDDWNGDTSLAMISDLPAESGDWTIYATSLSENEAGAYDLEILTRN